MRFKPNEIYGRVIEIGADAPKDLTLETFLTALRMLVADTHTSALPVSLFLDYLSAAAGLSAIPEVPAREPDSDGHADRARVVDLLDRQIADLREMALNGQLEDERRYFGIDAPSGHRWFNFDVHSFFECAATGSFHTLDPDGDEMDVLRWREVERFLELGQCYE
jgi:hypothetical protein